MQRGAVLLLVVCLAAATQHTITSATEHEPTDLFTGPRCPPNKTIIACTNSIPPSCVCGGASPPKPKPPIEPPGCLCPLVFDPVCGVDGNDYGNECEARCAGTTANCKGSCPCPPPIDCICTADYTPVCGVDGETYSNGCVARCSGVAVKCKGECPCGSLPHPGDCFVVLGRLIGKCRGKDLPILP